MSSGLRRRQWHPIPVLLPGKSHGQRSLVGFSPWGHSDMTELLHFHALEKEMAAHSSVLAWRIPGTGEPGGLPPMESHRVRHDWSDLAAAAAAAVAWIDFCRLQEKTSSEWLPRGQPCSSDLLYDEAKLWRMGGPLSGSTWHSKLGQVQVYSCPSSACSNLLTFRFQKLKKLVGITVLN